MVARVADVPAAVAARESAGALAAMAEEPAALVMACRRLVGSQPAAGLLWWLSARVLVAPDPADEALRVVEELDADPTVDHLVAELPMGARVVLVGSDDLTGPALDLRSDAAVLSVVAEVPGADGHGARADLILVGAEASGPGGLLVEAGALAAIRSWAPAPAVGVVGAGRALPAELWSRLLVMVDGDQSREVVAIEHLDAVVGPGGRVDPAELADRADCLPVPDLIHLPAPGGRPAR